MEFWHGDKEPDYKRLKPSKKDDWHTILKIRIELFFVSFSRLLCTSPFSSQLPYNTGDPELRVSQRAKSLGHTYSFLALSANSNLSTNFEIHKIGSKQKLCTELATLWDCTSMKLIQWREVEKGEGEYKKEGGKKINWLIHHFSLSSSVCSSEDFFCDKLPTIFCLDFQIQQHRIQQ